ncbi:protein MOST-1-like [Pongo pygmaeus]|uniref:protein MOST-1-like n=1 Tax=Pongo pygmaeus TaxID=9600 RepID=UPI0023E15A30|nr:protein MOST-1-like [Pongo pygmaeus]
MEEMLLVYFVATAVTAWSASPSQLTACDEAPPALQDAKPSSIKCVQGQMQWLTSDLPTLWEAEAGGLLEPRSLRPAWATL